MIRIAIDVERMQLRAEGHAGYAPPGRDIVCAAASALIYALCYNLERILGEGGFEAEIAPGRARVCVRAETHRADACRNAFRVIGNGLKLLAETQGAYVRCDFREGA